MTEQKHPAAIDINGEPHLRDARGRLVPIATVKAIDLLMDELVRSLLAEARENAKRNADFRARTFTAVSELQALLAQKYEAKIGGQKGNIQLLTFDGLQRVQIAVSDLIEFGPELQTAKALIDECLTEWAVDSKVELRALINRVFSVDKEGQINRAELFMLLRVEIADKRWQDAMAAIKDSIRVIGSRSYARYYDRDQPDGRWNAITDATTSAR
jgi:hypothetical protein